MKSQQKAIGYIRRDVRTSSFDLSALAERCGYRHVYTIVTDTGPMISGLVIAQHLHEHDAEAVVVPGFEHAEMIRSLITDLADLITPMQVYPLGYRWPTSGFDGETR
ncbi:hypothetical protein [Nocardia sp. NPDC051750]|uniref:hypothetical protein n=1 Tax=Nocardia sp. NPDC051750 TaxID=3364325 RepID=UPI0037895872